MKRIVTWIATCAALVFWSALAVPLAAQCSACSSSSTCAASSVRGGCTTSCNGEACACGDHKCRPEITVAPASPEYPARFAAGGSGGGEQWDDAVAFFLRDCDGSIELYVYSVSEDGMRPIESRLLLREPEPVSTARLALADGGGG
jgi:hypothetical protein